MRSQQPRQRPLLILLGLALIACAQATSAQIQTPAPAQNPAALPAQTPAQPPSRTVRLNVIVTDESNRSVTNLRQEDFRVEEDGVPQTITQFARVELPVSYTLIIDNSGSFKKILEHMLRAGGALVSANKPGDETSVTRFIDSEKIEVVQDFTANRSQLMEGLDSMYVEGGQTAVVDAVYLSAERLGELRGGEIATRRRALILLSDGEDRGSYYKQRELQKLLRKLDVQVFVIGIVEFLSQKPGFRSKSSKEKAVALLNSMAKETGGRVFFPKDIKELQDAVNEIARDLRAQYTISYEPTNITADGRFRTIQVKLNFATTGGTHTVHTRSGYVAPGATDVKKKDSKDKSSRPKSQ